MKLKTLLFAAIAIMAISCSKDDGSAADPTKKMTAEEFAALTPATLPDYDTWTITGDVTMSSAEFRTLMNSIDEELGEREISLVFQDETSLYFLQSAINTDTNLLSPTLVDNFVSVSAPNVTALGFATFGGCNWLTDVYLPKVTTLDNYTFYRCWYLTNISLPCAKNIGTYCFLEAALLKTADLPAVEEIEGRMAFAYCRLLNTLKLTSPNKITIVDDAFYCFYNIEGCTLYLHYNNSDLEGTDSLVNTDDNTTFKEIIYVNSDGQVTDADGNVL